MYLVQSHSLISPSEALRPPWHTGYLAHCVFDLPIQLVWRRVPTRNLTCPSSPEMLPDQLSYSTLYLLSICVCCFPRLTQHITAQKQALRPTTCAEQIALPLFLMSNPPTPTLHYWIVILEVQCTQSLLICPTLKPLVGSGCGLQSHSSWHYDSITDQFLSTLLPSWSRNNPPATPPRCDVWRIMLPRGSIVSPVIMYYLSVGTLAKNQMNVWHDLPKLVESSTQHSVKSKVSLAVIQCSVRVCFLFLLQYLSSPMRLLALEQSWEVFPLKHAVLTNQNLTASLPRSQ